MVKFKETVDVARGYGMNSSDNTYYKHIITECGCDLSWTHSHGVYNMDQDKIGLYIQFAETHEYLHTTKIAVELYIGLDEDSKTLEEIQNYFHLESPEMIEYALEWLTADVSKTWLRSITEKLTKMIKGINFKGLKKI